MSAKKTGIEQLDATEADRPPAATDTLADTSAGKGKPPLTALEGLVAAGKIKGPAPVELWNPPYCGDIGMKIEANGNWCYQGSQITRMPLVKLFASVLWRAEDGRHYLVTPAEKVDVEVADAPFLAVEMEISGAGCEQLIRFRTNVDDVVRCGPDHTLRFAVEPGHGGLKPYLQVRGRLEALLTRALTYDLIAAATIERQAGQDMLGIWSDGTFFGIAPAD